MAAPRIVIDEAIALIAAFDREDQAMTRRVYGDFPPGSDVTQIAETLRALLTGTAAGPRRPGKGEATASDGLQIVPQPDMEKIIVVADDATFAEVEELLELFRGPVDRPIVLTSLISLEHVGPEEVVELIEPLLTMYVNELLASGVLKGAAEPVAPPAGGKGRGAARTGSWFHLAADVRNQRVVIAAPQIVIDEAMRLIPDFDLPGADYDTIVSTVKLDNAAAEPMVKAIREMMGAPGRTRVTPRGGKPGETPEVGEFLITEAPGGRALVLRGTPDDVEQATGWIEELDVISLGGERIVKTYEINRFPLKQLVDLVMATVDTPEPSSSKQPRPRSARRRGVVSDLDEEDEWVTEITRTGSSVYIHANLITSTMLVSATPAKMAEIDALVSQLAPDDPALAEIGWTEPKVPKFIYELQYVKDAWDAELAATEIFDTVWPYEDTPKVSSTMWGNNLIIEYPYEEHFPEIEAHIKKYVDKPGEDDGQPKRVSLVAPEGMSAKELALLLLANNPHLDFELTNVSERSQKVFDVEQVGPPAIRATPCVLPGAFERAAEGIAAAAVGQSVEEGNG